MAAARGAARQNSLPDPEQVGRRLLMMTRHSLIAYCCLLITLETGGLAAHRRLAALTHGGGGGGAWGVGGAWRRRHDDRPWPWTMAGRRVRGAGRGGHAFQDALRGRPHPNWAGRVEGRYDGRQVVWPGRQVVRRGGGGGRQAARRPAWEDDPNRPGEEWFRSPVHPIPGTAGRYAGSALNLPLYIADRSHADNVNG